jgi:hypothetical protein
MPIIFGGQGVSLSLRGLPSNVFALEGGQSWIIPAGAFEIRLGKYTNLQEFDPVTDIWRNIGDWGVSRRVNSDGVNLRVANQTGCIVGALLTNAGSGYTSAPTVTASLGGSIWQAIVGGAVNTTVTVTAGGSGYTYPPIVMFGVPNITGPAGIQATGYSTLSGGAVSSITVVDQGAGYAFPPVISLLNDPREGVNGVPTGAGASAIATLTGAGTVTGLLCLDHGNPVTTTSTAALPTLAFSGGGGSAAAATAVMCWSLLSFTITTSGTSGLPATGLVQAYGLGSGYPSTAAAYTNPTTNANLVRTRQGLILPTIAAGAVSAVGTVVDGGIYSGINTLVTALWTPTATAPGATVSLTAPAFGPQNDVFYIYPM